MVQYLGSSSMCFELDILPSPHARAWPPSSCSYIPLLVRMLSHESFVFVYESKTVHKLLTSYNIDHLESWKVGALLISSAMYMIARVFFGRSPSSFHHTHDSIRKAICYLIMCKGFVDMELELFGLVIHMLY